MYNLFVSFCIPLNIILEGDVTVHSDVELYVDLDLNGESSLTCTSTGGPATNVTWTRGSEKIPGGITVLTNARHAQYIHTLILRERLGGLYQCTVANNKPSQASASITVQGKMSVHCYIIVTCTLYQCSAHTSDKV